MLMLKLKTFENDVQSTSKLNSGNFSITGDLAWLLRRHWSPHWGEFGLAFHGSCLSTNWMCPKHGWRRRWDLGLMFRADISLKTASTSHLAQLCQNITAAAWRLMSEIRFKTVDHCCFKKILKDLAPTLPLLLWPSSPEAHQRRSRANLAKMEVKTPGPAGMTCQSWDFVGSLARTVKIVRRVGNFCVQAHGKSARQPPRHLSFLASQLRCEETVPEFQCHCGSASVS